MAGIWTDLKRFRSRGAALTWARDQGILPQVKQHQHHRLVREYDSWFVQERVSLGIPILFAIATVGGMALASAAIQQPCSGMPQCQPDDLTVWSSRNPIIWFSRVCIVLSIVMVACGLTGLATILHGWLPPMLRSIIDEERWRRRIMHFDEKLMKRFED